MGPKLSSLPTVLSTVSHVLCFTLHPYLTYQLLTENSFTYPATLSLIQVTITAICLWFWTLFGLYRLRSIHLTQLFPLSASAAALALLALFTLATSSLLIFQTARLLSAILVLSVRHRTPAVGVLALASAYLVTFDSAQYSLIPICYTLFATVNALVIHPFAARIKASELQLQVWLRTLAAALLLPAVWLLDDVHSATGLQHFHFNDSSAVLLFASGIVAFLTFVSSRASVNHLTPDMHTWLLLFSNIAVFLCHFATSDHHFRTPHAFGIAGLAACWLFLAEKRKIAQPDDQPV